MDTSYLRCLFVIFLQLFQGFEGLLTCERRWNKYGCLIEGDAPLNSSDITNIRDPTNRYWDGVPFQTETWSNALQELACKCHQIAQEKEHRFFGLQYFGECWTGDTLASYKSNRSENCIDIKYEQCMDSNTTECVGRTSTYYLYETKIEEKAQTVVKSCNSDWEKLGCFIESDSFYDRTKLVNLRDPTNSKWDGVPFNSSGWASALYDLACKCAKLSEAKGHHFFGIHYFGECWTGDHLNSFSGGKSDNCIDTHYEPCSDANSTECVGRTTTSYIYRKKNINPTPQWSEWSEWSVCSKTCGGGFKERIRTCHNTTNVNQTCEGSSFTKVRCNTEACAPDCKSQLDIGILLDASGSVQWSNFQLMKEFLINFTRKFHVSKDGIHFGMVMFSHRFKTEFKISDERYWNETALEDKIKSVRYLRGGTRTDIALKVVEEDLFCDTCGIRGDVPKILIVITDGVSDEDSESMTVATAGLKEKRVTIISIGIGRTVNKQELIEIAKDERHMFLIEDFKFLVDKMNALLMLSCNANAYKLHL